MVVLIGIFGIGPKIYQRKSMIVVTIGTYSQAGFAALANATYEQRRAIMDEIFGSAGGKIIEYFFFDGDANFYYSCRDTKSRGI